MGVGNHYNPVPWYGDSFDNLGQNIARCEIHGRKGHALEQGGIIYKVGSHYVDLLQDDDTIIRVITERITKLKWVDKNCHNKCFHNYDFEDLCNDNKSLCSHCYRHHRDCLCGKEYDRIIDSVIPFCDSRIHLRLAGLTDSLNYELFRNKGCKVILELTTPAH